MFLTGLLGGLASELLPPPSLGVAVLPPPSLDVAVLPLPPDLAARGWQGDTSRLKCKACNANDLISNHYIQHCTLRGARQMSRVYLKSQPMSSSAPLGLATSLPGERVT